MWSWWGFSSGRFQKRFPHLLLEYGEAVDRGFVPRRRRIGGLLDACVPASRIFSLAHSHPLSLARFPLFLCGNKIILKNPAFEEGLLFLHRVVNQSRHIQSDLTIANYFPGRMVICRRKEDFHARSEEAMLFETEADHLRVNL